jgi:hypothetical protein
MFGKAENYSALIYILTAFTAAGRGRLCVGIVRTVVTSIMWYLVILFYFFFLIDPCYRCHQFKSFCRPTWSMMKKLLKTIIWMSLDCLVCVSIVVFMCCCPCNCWLFYFVADSVFSNLGDLMWYMQLTQNNICSFKKKYRCYFYNHNFLKFKMFRSVFKHVIAETLAGWQCPEEQQN